jgi:hypothetical protein
VQYLVVSTADKIVIPIGTRGKVYMSNEGAHLLRWSFDYSCWQLFLLELDAFLQYMPHTSGIFISQWPGKFSSVFGYKYMKHRSQGQRLQFPRVGTFLFSIEDRERQQMVNKVLDIVEILNNVLFHNWSKITSLVNLVDRVYYIVQK